jgi:hypothetical protein
MNVSWVVRDPAPDAARGTLEYAASAAACTRVLRIELTPEEARKLAFQMDSCDCHGVRGGIKELSDLETFINVMLTDQGT